MLVVLIADGRRRNGEWYYLYLPREEEEKGTKFSWNGLHLHLVSLFLSLYFDGILIQWLISFRGANEGKRVLHNIPYISPVFTIVPILYPAYPAIRYGSPSCPKHIYPSRARFIFLGTGSFFFFLSLLCRLCFCECVCVGVRGAPSHIEEMDAISISLLAIASRHYSSLFGFFSYS
jgi:hypothetical protein